MATSEYGTERLNLEHRKVSVGYERTQWDSLTDAISRSDTNIAKGYSELGAATAEIKRDMIGAVARYQAAQQSGSAARRMQATVELRKLMVNAPIDFAKAAYAPDEARLREIRIAANPSGDTNTTNSLIASKAWQVYYSTLVEGAGNEWGTYREMLDTYGPDTQALGSEGGLEVKRTRLKQTLAKEEGAAANFQQAYQTLVDYPGAFERFLKDHPNLDPNAESTYEAFENDTGMRERLPRIKDTPFIAGLQKAAENIETGRDDLYRKDYLSGIQASEAARDRDIALRNKLAMGDGEPGPTEDTDRDLMAAWLKRPDVQAWAKQNGLRVGRVVEVTEQQKADIAAGKIPASTVTKYGMLTDGPDDQKAVNFAYKQMARTPERDLFRRAGFTRSGLANTVVEVEIGRDPALYKDPDSGKFYTDSKGEHVKLEDVAGKYTGTVGVREDGWVGTLPDGTYVWSTDSGKSWAPVSKGVGERLSEGVKSKVDGAVIGLNVTDAPPAAKTYRGVRRPMLVNDAAGSVRWVDEETGREEYANPEDIRRTNEPGVRSDATRTTLADRVGGAVVKGALKKSGLGQDENDMDIGEKPAQRKAFSRQYPGGGGASVQARRERSEMLEALPTVPDAALDERFNPRPSTDAAVAEYTQRAKMSDTANSTGSDVTDRRSQPGNAALSQFVTNPKPDASGGVIGVAGRDMRTDAEKARTAAKPLGQQFTVQSTAEAARSAPINKALNENAKAEKEAQEAAAASKLTVDATTPSTTTPTASTDRRRQYFKQRRFFNEDAEGNPEP